MATVPSEEGWDKMDVIELAAEKPKPEFSFKEGRTTGRIIFETRDLVIGYDEPLSKPLNLSMERGEKVALIGANGIGKTTLLKSILGLIPPLSGEVEQGDYLEIGYFEQEMSGSGDELYRRDSGRSSPPSPSMRSAPPWQDADSPPSILRAA